MTIEWDAAYPNCILQSLSSGCSDHAPLSLLTDTSFQGKRRFRFENIWPKYPGYLETIQGAWQCTLSDADPLRCLDWFLRNTAKAF
uniref:Endonuclease/exonuclease/phosphatase domain-containing protein n=1 Tax=Arundo donax TaxID=35708 RepID=A0A0A8ZQ97_ARUDO